MRIQRNGHWQGDGDIEIYGIEGLVSNLRARHFFYKDKKRKIFPLCSVDLHAWKAMSRLGISGASWTIECPYTNLLYSPILPFAILTSDLSKFREAIPHYNQGWALGSIGREMIIRKMPKAPTDMIVKLDAVGEPGKIERVLLGTGYDSGIGPDCGSAILDVGVMETSDNDYVLCYHWVWYNK